MMANALHMYPSVIMLLWVWGAGVLLQVIAMLGCLKEIEEDTRVARTGTEEEDDGRDVHVFEWTQLARRSVVATLMLTVVSIGTSTVVLKLRTGFYVEQPYEWYGLETTGKRLFQGSHNLPSDIMDTCRFHDAMAAHTKMQTLDPVIDRYAASQQEREVQGKRTLVHVVPFDYNHVLELQQDQLLPIVEPLPEHWTASSSSGDEDQDAAAIVTSGFVKARPVDEITLFPYLWHSLLGPFFDPRVGTPPTDPSTRVIDALNLEFRVVHNAQELRDLPAHSNLLVAAQSLDCVNRFFEGNALPSEPRVGFFTLANENCNNPGPERFSDNSAIKFGLLPYGDCALVDGSRFASMPLGPSFEHGFPLNAHHLNPPPPLATGTGRKFLLNLMVSWTIEKPTRVQAMMAALQVCEDLELATLANSRRCVVEHNDMLFKALQAVDKRLGTAWRWYLSAAPAAYVSTLQQSVFTICPLGKNPEQYRIWEALSAGSIPIVEELPAQCQPPGVFFHPAYPDSWRCVPEDVHGVLRRLNAPVLFVSDWKRDLPRLMGRYFTRSNTAAGTTDSKQGEYDSSKWGEWTPTEELMALQARTRSWYVGLSHHLQADLIDKVVTHFLDS
ncbi:hypothetical protein BBO99_00004697 [Phytophthora kernoviae]|uniref:RXYLT1 C-terminal domain-containing protein n=2 Tax=Phytophthora kernoviae TaxID=325452 RepID=A0A3R7GZM8_9STRA|nr:hypothetical protein G195_009834 [Phytophthora kernoviae 00238/432]KAG2527162.1 hypothetical protein JM18_003999 [Phytophthora kernoviae]KAG2528736.1 hypothetical protein JM16_002549 [Phytophthora kernoviae]RLN37954.1 hypothetical protein BBI17_002934 [Phytophthora kernoviae]RLN80189.1 hypothetical protein BBO99_00004697 [Phytophthora kernoviae]